MPDRSQPHLTLLISLSFFIGGVLAYWGCSSSGDDHSSGTYSKQIREGKELAQTYCGSCHVPVAPDMLDKKTWINGVLPVMAPKLGIRIWQQNKYYPAGTTEGKTSISFENWMKIVNYYQQMAPETLKAGDPPVPLQRGSEIFKVEKPAATEYPSETAATTMVKIDPQGGAIYTSDANENALIRWDKNLKSRKLLSFDHPLVDMLFLDEEQGQRSAVLTNIGTMKAEDISQGVVETIRLADDAVHIKEVIGTELTRPLHALPGDFNKDGLRDWIICVFGHDTGGLYLFEQESGQSYTRKTIRDVPGAEDAVIDDFNNDGWPDLMVLFAYDNEGIWLFTNNKEGGFSMENILQFPPVYGSTSFELTDINRDGMKDILLTNGDNADFSPILKPYHGLRIFLNQGNNKFEESYFYPINGTTEVVANDFDQDGDLDLAIIAFFADFKHTPSESFIFFENQGQDGLNFIPHSMPVNEYGRWLDMDAADFDRDGDMDIVLGNFSRQFMGEGNTEPTWNTQTPFLLLLNKKRDR